MNKNRLKKRIRIKYIPVRSRTIDKVNKINKINKDK